MHQTFYIDIDEEITSVVERLRKAKANEIVMVIPKRALLLQSIVNLRLLKKEAQSSGLQLMIVTQDKLGKILVEKAGILVQQKLDDTLEEVVDEEDVGPFEKDLGALSPDNNIVRNETINVKDRLNNIGSENYFDLENAEETGLKVRVTKPRGRKQDKAEESEKIINKELITGLGSDLRKKSSYSFMDSTKGAASSIDSLENTSRMEKMNSVVPAKPVETRSKQIPSGDAQQEKIRNFFYGNAEQKMPEPKREVDDGHSSFSFKKFGLVIVSLIILAVVLIGAYLYIPKATVSLSIKQKAKAQDLDIMGDSSISAVDYAKQTIPIKVISAKNELTKTFPISSAGASAEGKAKGTVTIYNEFASTSQSLVATTRFETEDGKIYRLTKGVTIPGTTKSGTEVKPGKIDAEVTADQAGENYNIGPAKFSIPGFKNSGDKFTKIYGVSSGSMAGGGAAAAGSSDQSGKISQADVDSAKNKIVAELNETIKNKLKESAGEGIINDDALNINEASYKLSSPIGTVAQNFDLTAESQGTALVFDEDDLKNAVGKVISNAAGGSANVETKDVSLQYGKLEPNFKEGTINIKVHANAQIGSGLDLEKLKQEIAGKTNDEFEAYLNSFPEIQKAEVTYWPPFISSSIPKNAGRVEIVLDNQ